MVGEPFPVRLSNAYIFSKTYYRHRRGLNWKKKCHIGSHRVSNTTLYYWYNGRVWYGGVPGIFRRYIKICDRPRERCNKTIIYIVRAGPNELRIFVFFFSLLYNEIMMKSSRVAIQSNTKRFYSSENTMIYTDGGLYSTAHSYFLYSYFSLIILIPPPSRDLHRRGALI